MTVCTPDANMLELDHSLCSLSIALSATYKFTMAPISCESLFFSSKLLFDETISILVNFNQILYIICKKDYSFDHF